MGFVGNLENEGYDRQYSDLQLINRMKVYYKPHIRRLVGIVVLLLVNAGAGVLTPILVGRGVDLVKADSRLVTTLYLSGALLLANLIFWTAFWIRRRLSVRTVADVELALREDAFRAAAQHDLSFYDEHSSGKIVSRITSDTKEFSNVVVLVTDTFSQIIQSVILLTYLFTIEWKMSLLLLVFIPLVFYVTKWFRVLARAISRQGMRAMANVNATIKETVSGIAVAKNFRQEQAIFSDFDAANQTSYRVNVRRGLIMALVFPALNALSGLATAALIYMGGITVAAGVISVGAWFLFIQSLDRFFWPVLNLASFWPQVQGGLSAAERVFALIDAEPAVTQLEQRKVFPLRGEIVFDHVSFRYSDRQQVLDDFSLHIHPGENLALVGHTGAGKSSIAKLIARFYEFQGGKIIIDGHDIRSLHLPTYRSQLGIVSQQPFLFAGTVAENICYACPSDTELEAMEAMARKIGDGEWLDTLPQGLQTQVGERGAQLSMGQRQLVSLMRILVQQPSIFILDEATASIDPFTEWQIQQALKLILSRTTSILIAHRLSTVKAADRIIVLEQGKIIEEGNHQSLLDAGGHYSTLYNTYFRHQSLDYKPAGMEEFLRNKIEANTD